MFHGIKYQSIWRMILLSKSRKPPCYGCTERLMGCHDRCPKYLGWKQERQDVFDKNKLEIETARKLTDTEVKRYTRNLQRKKNKRRFGR